MQSLGRHIRARRQSMGLTLDALAQRAGCTKGYLSAIETGRRPRPPSRALLARIESALELDAAVLTRRAAIEAIPPEARAAVRALERRSRDAARLAALVLQAAPAAPARRLARRLLEDAPPRPAPIPLASPAPGAPDDYITAPIDVPEDAFAITIEDDAMRPLYNPADIVIVAPASSVPPAADCLVSLTSAATLFRRIYPGAADDTLRLQPLNHVFPPDTLAAARVSAIARALYHIRRTPPPDSPSGLDATL